MMFTVKPEQAKKIKELLKKVPKPDVDYTPPSIDELIDKGFLAPSIKQAIADKQAEQDAING